MRRECRSRSHEELIRDEGWRLDSMRVRLRFVEMGGFRECRGLRGEEGQRVELYGRV